MKNRLWIIGIVTVLTVVFVSIGTEGDADNSSPIVSTIAGQKASGGANDGTGSDAGFSFSAGITTDGTNLYIADTFNHTIRKMIISSVSVTTLAGTAGVSGSDDGIGSVARFNSPHGITTDGSNLYVADTYNNTIRKINITSGEVTTLAGVAGITGAADGTGSDALFSGPYGIMTDGENLYVADIKNSTIREIVIATGVVTTIAGKAGEVGSFDGCGSSARFNYPTGITTDGTNLFIVDRSNNTIRKLVPSTGEVSTVAGTAGSSGSTDGQGGTALFNDPHGITSDGINLYITDEGNKTIRQIVVSSGQVSTLAGSVGKGGGDDGLPAAARFNIPTGIVVTSGTGTTLFIVDMGTIRKVH